MKIQLSQRDVIAALNMYFSNTFNKPMEVVEFDFTATRRPNKSLTVDVDVEPIEDIAIVPEVNEPVVAETVTDTSAIVEESPELDDTAVASSDNLLADFFKILGILLASFIVGVLLIIPATILGFLMPIFGTFAVIVVIAFVIIAGLVTSVPDDDTDSKV